MLLVAWIVYFAIWGGSQFLLGKKVSNLATVLIVAISFADLIYLGMHDLKSLILVILATVFALMGVVRMITLNMKGGE